MNLIEAKQILEENGFIVEGAYKDILHQKFAQKRAEREQNNKDFDTNQRKTARLAKKMSKEIEEFVSDLADEMVSDEVTCKYNPTDWITTINVKSRKYKVDTLGYGQVEFCEESYGRWRIIYRTTDLNNLDDFLEKVFEFITEEAA